MPSPTPSTEPSIGFLTLQTYAEEAAKIPWLKERLGKEPPRVTAGELRALDPVVRDQVLALLERSAAQLRHEGERYRSLHNPKDRAAAQLEAFIAAVRK